MPRYIVSGRFLAQPLTGVQRFARELLAALDRQLGPNSGDWFIAMPSRDARANVPAYKSIESIVFRGSGDHLWEQSLALRDPTAVFIGLTNSAPLGARSQAIVIHDAGLFDRVPGYSWTYKLPARTLQSLALRRSTLPLTVSDFSARRLERATGVRASVIYPGTDHILREDAQSGAFQPVRPYLLAVGLAPHKFGIPLPSVLDQARRVGLDLVVVGEMPSRVFESNESRLGLEGLHCVGRVSDGELKWLMQNASAYLHLSRYEGFGLPPLEAQRVGCPVVAWDNEINREVLGHSALLVDEESDVFLRSLEVLSDARETERIKELGFANSGRFTWSSAASGFHASVLRSFGQVASSRAS